MTDDRFNSIKSYEGPATKAFAITPSDTVDLTLLTRGIYTGIGGTLVCILAEDSAEVTLNSVPAGIILPLRVKRVKSTGTTASMGLIGLD